jgi:hypothetical protein
MQDFDARGGAVQAFSTAHGPDVELGTQYVETSNDCTYGVRFTLSARRPVFEYPRPVTKIKS